MSTTLNRDAELSTLSNAAYLDKPPAQIGNWTLIKPSDPNSSGFFGVAYMNAVTKQVVVSYNDILEGGIGADTLIGGIGDDLYRVDSTADVVTEGAGEGTDTVRSVPRSATLCLATSRT